MSVPLPAGGPRERKKRRRRRTGSFAESVDLDKKDLAALRGIVPDSTKVITRFQSMIDAESTKKVFKMTPSEGEVTGKAVWWKKGFQSRLQSNLAGIEHAYQAELKTVRGHAGVLSDIKNSGKLIEAEQALENMLQQVYNAETISELMSVTKYLQDYHSISTGDEKHHDFTRAVVFHQLNLLAFMIWRALPPPTWWNDESIEDAERLAAGLQSSASQGSLDSEGSDKLRAAFSTRLLEKNENYPKMCTCFAAKVLQSKEHNIVGDGDWGALFEAAENLDWPEANEHFLIDANWGENPMLLNLMGMYLKGHPWVHGENVKTNGLGLKASEAWGQIQAWVLTAFRDHLSAVLGKIKDRKEKATAAQNKLIGIASTAALSAWTFLLHVLQSNETALHSLGGNSTLLRR